MAFIRPHVIGDSGTPENLLDFRLRHSLFDPIIIRLRDSWRWRQHCKNADRQADADRKQAGAEDIAFLGHAIILRSARYLKQSLGSSDFYRNSSSINRRANDAPRIVPIFLPPVASQVRSLNRRNTGPPGTYGRRPQKRGSAARSAPGRRRDPAFADRGPRCNRARPSRR